MSTYNTLKPAKLSLHTLFHFIFIRTLRGKQYYLHFLDERSWNFKKDCLPQSQMTRRHWARGKHAISRARPSNAQRHTDTCRVYTAQPRGALITVLQLGISMFPKICWSFLRLKGQKGTLYNTWLIVQGLVCFYLPGLSWGYCFLKRKSTTKHLDNQQELWSTQTPEPRRRLRLEWLVPLCKSASVSALLCCFSLISEALRPSM